VGNNLEIQALIDEKQVIKSLKQEEFTLKLSAEELAYKAEKAKQGHGIAFYKLLSKDTLVIQYENDNSFRFLFGTNKNSHNEYEFSLFMKPDIAVTFKAVSDAYLFGFYDWVIITYHDSDKNGETITLAYY
jgi:hypothetical protein